MAHRFKNTDRDTPMLLPPDLRDWVGQDDLVHFVIQAVERLPLTAFAVNHKGCGDEQYPPHTMLALLIYCYANGIFSSRRIERATYRDVAVRYLTADTHPDHDTICAFRRNNLDAIAASFVDVLELARELKLLELGTVSLDGTHIRASASKDKNVTYERAQQLRAQLRQDVDALLQQAEGADRKNEDPQKLPKEIARREALLEKMDAACSRLEARARARAEAQRADYERKVGARQQREGSTKGPSPKPPPETPEPHEQINLTDPQARLMRKSKREGFTQSYNAQAVVDADGSQLILGQRVSTCASDAGELEADLQSIPETLGSPTTALADCGYVDKEVFERLGEERPGLQLYVSVHREDAHAERRYDWRPPDKIKPPKTITDPVLLAMADKLKTPEGRLIYRKRACTVEPAFGIIKAVLGFRQFLLRGLPKVSGEWNLVCLAYNFKRLHRLGAGLNLAPAS
ncbi:MAG: IS1182 family transposase [Immundisolibacter sp.]|uniref:IS1182 family transposase n=1 Tax=Immundisolibacter sp. TaxID=1934948 RepID=UPI003EE053C0